MSHSFKDVRGRAWNLEVNCDTISQVKEKCNVNLLDLADPDSGLMRETITFPPLLAKFLFAAVADQAAAMKVDEKDFCRAMSGDAIAEATDALLAEIVAFFPKSRRELLTAVLEKNKEVETAGQELLLARLADPALKEQALATMDRRVRLQIEESLRELGPQAGPSATSSSASAGPPPDSSASPAPALTPGGPCSDSPTGPGGPIAG